MQDYLLLNSERLAMSLAQRGIQLVKSSPDRPIAIGSISMDEVTQVNLSDDDLSDTLAACNMYGERDSERQCIRIFER